MDYEEALNYTDDYDILDDEEIYLLDDEHIIERIESQKRKKPKIEDWN